MGVSKEGFTALENISFDIAKGSCFGIIGQNGSGKSTLLQLISGISSPDSGDIRVIGKVSALLELGSGFNFDFTGRENVSLYSSIIGTENVPNKKIVDGIIEFAEIDDFIDQPLSTYSSGMVARLAFATRIFLDFDILILDEILSVGDAYFQRKCFRYLENLKGKGKTIIFVSHSTNQLLEICDTALVLEGGRLSCIGDPKDCVDYYLESINAKSAQNLNLDLLGSENLGKYYGQGKCLLKNFEINKIKFIEQPINLVYGEVYKIKVVFDVLSPLDDLEFGITLKTLTGINLSNFKIQIGTFDSAENCQQIDFNFHCLVNSGNYFVTCGFGSSETGKRVFQSRYFDFCQIVVRETLDSKCKGYFKLFQS